MLFNRPLLIAICIIIFSTYSQAIQKPFNKDGKKLFFIENKGQIKDQHAAARNDIQFAVRSSGMNVFVGTGALHFQFYRSNAPQLPDKKYVKQISNLKNNIYTYRLDVSLEGANENSKPITENLENYYEIYFQNGNKPSGEKELCWQKVTYKNIYPNIDWVLHIRNNKLEQDFVINPGGDPADIKIRYNGQTNVSITGDGSIVAETPMGNIKELPPVCYMPDNSIENIKYQLHGNKLSYLTDKNDAGFVIDPTLEWGTYYGPDTNYSPIYCVTSDSNANIYACGFTYAGSTDNIATVGSFQDTAGANGDAYLVKFDSSGNRLWATYYGGEGMDWAYAVTCDHDQNIYMCGITGTGLDSVGIATPGAEQVGLGGGATGGASNGFLVKFTPDGTRVWGTYYGGDQQDAIYGLECDDYGNIYFGGVATSEFNIATPGSFEPTYVNPGYQYAAGFLAKFDTSGHRYWGTYYEGFDSTGITDVFNSMVCVDGGYAYLSGFTSATDSIATAGSWQPVMGGSGDAYIAKFDSAGHRVWGTYYGGTQQETSGGISSDKAGTLFLFGGTYSDSSIASAAAFQPTRGGGEDAFIAAFNDETCVRIWGTYFGGPSDENEDNSRIDTYTPGLLYITGCTESSSGIASATAWQATYGGGPDDGYVAAYTPSGTQKWATYYGGAQTDRAFACTFDGLNVYICGQTNSTNQIATPGSFDSTSMGGTYSYKGFLGKFADVCSTPVVSSFSDSTIDTSTVTLVYTGTMLGLDSVVWNYGDSITDTGLIKIYTFPVADTYLVCVTAYTSCGIDTGCSYVATYPSAIATLSSAQGIYVYPNPATTQLIVYIPGENLTGTKQYKLISASGICELTGTLSSGANILPMNDIPPGLYILKVISQQGTSTTFKIEKR